MNPHAPLMAALDRAGIEHRDLLHVASFQHACAVIHGVIVRGVTMLPEAVRQIDEWAEKRTPHPVG